MRPASGKKFVFAEQPPQQLTPEKRPVPPPGRGQSGAPKSSQPPLTSKTKLAETRVTLMNAPAPLPRRKPVDVLKYANDIV